MPDYIVNLLLFGKKLRNKLLFDIYDNVDPFSFYKSYFKKTQENKKIIINICR